MRGYGVASLIVLVFSWLALDDITTDDANEFPLEYTILVLAGIWFAVLGGTLVAKRRLSLGVFSLAAVAVAVVAFWSLPHHYQPPSPVTHLGWLPIVWFLGLSVWLVAGRAQAGDG